MGSNGVVSIRDEALSVSITIVDGNIAIEQTRTEIPAAGVTPKVESPAAATSGAVLASAVITERVPPLPKDVDDSTVRGDSATPLIDNEQAPDRPSLPGRNGPAGLPGDFDKGQESRASQTKSVWSDEEIEKLRALYPTHSPRAIANATRAKFHCSTEQGPEFGSERGGAATLFDHHPGQCRWIVSDVWPVIYCGAPVVDSSSWCEQHSRRVFNPRPQGLTGISR